MGPVRSFSSNNSSVKMTDWMVLGLLMKSKTTAAFSSASVVSR